MCVIKAEASDTKKTPEIIKDKNCEKQFFIWGISKRAKDIGAQQNVKNLVLCHH